MIVHFLVRQSLFLIRNAFSVWHAYYSGILGMLLKQIALGLLVAAAAATAVRRRKPFLEVF